MSRRDFGQHGIGRQNLAFNASHKVRSQLVVQILGDQIGFNHWLSFAGIRQSAPPFYIANALDKVRRERAVGDLLSNLPSVRWRQSVIQIGQQSS